MKVLLYSRNGQYPKSLEQPVKNRGLEIVQQNPDVVITFGGDGTLLGAERDFPQIPKLPLKDSGVGFHTISLPVEQTLDLFVQNKLRLLDFFKLEAIAGDHKIVALNEISIRNKLINSALRYDVSITNQSEQPLNFDNLIGDGLIIATPFGATGYFYSIARQTFTQAVGIAFNNTHNHEIKPLIIADNSSVEIKITRGPAELSADNNPEITTLFDNQMISIKKSAEIAKIYTLS